MSLFSIIQELDTQKIYRTTYMFSATMPPAVERLARKYLRNPVVVSFEDLLFVYIFNYLYFSSGSCYYVSNP